jgi:4-hydroxy 2-oxovalerate aldolase
MKSKSRILVLDTTLRDGSHAIAHQFSPAQVATVAEVLDSAGVWAIAVGHGDGLGAWSRQYGFGRHRDEELISVAAGVVKKARIGTVLLPGIGTKADLRSARDSGANLVRISTLCTEADIGLQHIDLGRKLGMEVYSHLTMAHLGSPAKLAEGARLVADAGSQGAYLVDSAGALFPDEVRARIAAMRDALPAEVAVGIHAHNNLSMAVANSLAAVQEGATLIDSTLAGMGAGAGNCQTEAVLAVLDRLGYETGVNFWMLQDLADSYVRKSLMNRPQEIDRLTATLGYGGVPASFLLHAERAARRFGVDCRDIIVELGRRKAVVGQEDIIIDVAAQLAKHG